VSEVSHCALFHQTEIMHAMQRNYITVGAYIGPRPELPFCTGSGAEVSDHMHAQRAPPANGRIGPPMPGRSDVEDVRCGDRDGDRERDQDGATSGGSNGGRAVRQPLASCAVVCPVARPTIENRLPHVAPLFSSRARPSMPRQHTAIYAQQHCNSVADRSGQFVYA
jgi:hypothetical protein